MRRNSYNHSKYYWTDRDMLKASIFGAVVGAFVALIFYFEVFYVPAAVPVFRPLIG